MSEIIHNSIDDKMAKVVSLCKRRGFVFQSSEIYGGLKSCYDFGPLGSLLKRNIANYWWQKMVTERPDVYGLDASILMHTDVWRASGHIDNFADPLVDCLNCKERFRADKQPKRTPGENVTYVIGGKKGGVKKTGQVSNQGYICPSCSSTELSSERMFRGMFRTTMGAVDPIGECIDRIYKEGLDLQSFKKELMEALDRQSTYLRPETAQSMFVQFANIVNTTGARIPFGIAQHGKSFRNEIIVEHFIFRSCEFEQLEMEFFCEPSTEDHWLNYWTDQRINWYRTVANHPDHFRLRAHNPDELAHYAKDCFDVEYLYPWGWDELEGIASRTDYDLRKHQEASKVKLSYFDNQKIDPVTQKPGSRYIPYVIEPAAGLTRSFLCFLLDAYTEEHKTDSDSIRTVLKLHPQFAPYKAAFLPLVKKDNQPELANKLATACSKKGYSVSFDENQSIGKRYAKHDEIGTPFCVTIDNQSMLDQTMTVRDRDTLKQERIHYDHILTYLIDHI